MNTVSFITIAGLKPDLFLIDNCQGHPLFYPDGMVCSGEKVATFAVSFSSGMHLASRLPAHLAAGKLGMILSNVANGVFGGKPAMMQTLSWKPVDKQRRRPNGSV